MQAPRPKIQSVELSLRIVQLLAELDGARVTEVADRLDIAPSTAHNHLTTLRYAGFAAKEGDEYYPSMEFAKLGRYVRTRKDGYELAEAKVESLAEETGGRVHFGVEEHGRGRYIYTSTGDRAVKTSIDIGAKYPLHVTAAGKAILSSMSDSRVESIVDVHGLSEGTERSISGRPQLFEELAEIRERGFALNLEEHVDGIRAIAAPVHESNGHVLGALTISGPARRMNDSVLHDELSELLPAVVNELELEVKYTRE